jgi:hypothetical protein
MRLAPCSVSNRLMPLRSFAPTVASVDLFDFGGTEEDGYPEPVIHKKDTNDVRATSRSEWLSWVKTGCWFGTYAAAPVDSARYLISGCRRSGT